ncbi:MAG: hypothetical protein ABFS35_20780 [Bacteroidota bacterium]
MDNQNKFWKLPELGGLELHQATYRGYSFTPHFHMELILYFDVLIYLNGAINRYLQ